MDPIGNQQRLTELAARMEELIKNPHASPAETLSEFSHQLEELDAIVKRLNEQVKEN